MWSIIGHSAALAALQRALHSERSPHAWLFAGPEGVGKAATAIEFAAALNCISEAKPCGECRPCRDALSGRHPDVEVVAPGGICDEPDHRDHPESRDLRICQIRRLDRLLTLTPYAGGRRVAIVDAADTMRAEAANAFLKTLEEPPGESVIVLLVEREERLPETVLSRCQKLRFRPVDKQTIREALLAENADPEAAASIAAAAAGKLGWALRTLKDSSLLEERTRWPRRALPLGARSRKSGAGRQGALPSRA
jgi:DNA polymerase III subunit delta'